MKAEASDKNSFNVEAFGVSSPRGDFRLKTTFMDGNSRFCRFLQVYETLGFVGLGNSRFCRFRKL